MGLKKWLIKKLIGREISKMSNDKNSVVADEYLKQMTSKHARTMRDAEKINKAKVLSLQESDLRRELKEGLDDDDYEDEEEEAPAQSLENTIGQMLMKKFLGGDIPGNVEGSPVNHEQPLDVSGIPTSQIMEAAASLTPEQKEALKTKLMGGV